MHVAATTRGEDKTGQTIMVDKSFYSLFHWQIKKKKQLNHSLFTYHQKTTKIQPFLL